MGKLTKYISSSEYDLYHARYGRGAVIVAIKKSKEEKNKKGTINSDLHVAQVFSSKTQSLDESIQALDPIKSIEEKDGFIILTVKFERRHQSSPSYRPMNAVVKRVIPLNQVTVEIVEINESQFT